MKNKLKTWALILLSYVGAVIISLILGRTLVGAICHIICASFEVQDAAHTATQWTMRVLVPIIAFCMIYFIKLGNEENFEAFKERSEGKQYSLKADALQSFGDIDLWAEIAIVSVVTLLVFARYYMFPWILLNIPLFVVFQFLSNIRIHTIWKNTVTDGFEVEDSKKKGKIEIEEQEIGSAERARAYGGTRRVGALDRFNEFAGHILYVLYRGWAYVVLSLYALILIALLNKIGVVIWVSTLVLFVYIKILKLPRKRLKLYRRVKRMCKKHGHRFEVRRRALNSLKYSKDGYDFKVDIGNDVYIVRLFTVSKHNCRMTFNDKNNVNVVAPCPRANRIVAVKNGVGRATVRTYEARGFGIMRIKAYEIRFPQNVSTFANKTMHNVLLVNLTPLEMYRRVREGGTIPTGTGEDMGDYMIYTANDFVKNLLDREIPHYQSDGSHIIH